MRVNRYVLAALAAWSLAAAGCWYQRPEIEDMYADVKVGMTKDDVIEALGQPTAVLGDTGSGDAPGAPAPEDANEMFYLYDDPVDPVRFRFVLNDKGVVIEKYYETKKELAKRAEETKGKLPPLEPMPGEDEPGRRYPGGPLKRFGTVPGVPERIK
ncbi:MAG: hypothetical protein AMK72_13805 [Planctomycetes bacterium SM23_25]|nr:MAG: hypothetical protein AMS14_04365 [Planctomycetes bacterium DG_20]KPK43073.1 MAG: hypothetical protein AMK72_13805 [Planctomycetes bacterium SM23_25]